MIKQEKIDIVSFFAGAGFLDLGFEMAGYDVTYVNEYFEPFLDAYKYSRKNMGLPSPKFGFHSESIESFLSGEDCIYLSNVVRKSHEAGRLVGFIGGPPCPDFSVGGKNKGRIGDNGRLSEVYVDIIIEQKPDFFVFENVKGLWRTKKHRAFYDELKEKLESNGYKLSDKLINSISYGAPQDRERIILFGVNKNSLSADSNEDIFDWNEYAVFPDRSAFEYIWPQTNKFKNKSFAKKPMNIPEELTVEYWFNRNEVENHPNSVHSFTPKAGLAKFKVIEEGDDSKKSYKRLHRWRYSPTACYGNNEVHLHPYLERRISAAEALAIQSLPKDFVLPADMTLTNMFKTIGNGVPFLAALALAKTIKKFLIKVSHEESDSKQSGECYQQAAAE